MANIRHMTILDARGRRARKAFSKLGIKRFFAGTAVFFCRYFFQLGKPPQTQLVRLVPVSRGLAWRFWDVLYDEAADRGDGCGVTPASGGVLVA